MPKRRKIILERFQKLLQERGGVSAEVGNEAFNITNLIIKGIKEGSWSQEADKVEKKYLSFDCNIYGTLWHIDCPVFNFLGEGSYWTNKDKYILNSTTNFETKRLLLYIPVINGNGVPQNTLFDTVFHEVAHVFQNFKGAHTYDDSLYVEARALYGSSILTETMIGKTLYYSFRYEQDAIIHGTWGELSKLYGLSYQQAFPQTIGYIAYKDFEDALNYCKTHESDVKNIIKGRLTTINDTYNYNWLLRRGRNAFKRFEKKLALVLEKFELTSQEHKGVVIEPPKPMSENKKLIIYDI